MLLGEQTQAVSQTVAGASGSIGYVTPHGTRSKAKGLVPETADANSTCAWTWNIVSATQPGTGTVTITANGARQSFPVVVQ